ncbi:MAG: SAM-dependent methyltransferase, partial [Limnothrix sp.]
MTIALDTAIHNIINHADQNAITFAQYMDLALYHPEQGYYNRKQTDIGKQGDFFTASSLGVDFGELLAEQLLQMQTVLQLELFQIVEMGAGKGHLAKDILHYITATYPEKAKQIEYIIIEKSSILRQQQQKELANLTSVNIRWCEWDDLKGESISGCFLSNELLDAFPVHRVVVQAGKLREKFVTTDTKSSTGLKEVIGELSNSNLKTYFEKLGIELSNYPEGYSTEVNLQMLDWLNALQSKLKLGYILTVDYGYPAAKYFHPQRSDGTLQAYFQHRRHNDPYV